MPPTATPRDLTHYTKRGKVRQRANVACTRCHHRRIKCSASVTGLPCDGCRQSGQGTAQACQIAVSGRSDRSSTHLSMAPSEPSQSQSPVQALGYTPQTPQTPPTSRSSEARSSITVQDDSNNLYAQILDSSTEPGPSRAASSSAQRPTSSPQVVYLGETFNLTHLLYTTNPHARRKAHGYHRSMAPSRSATRSSILSDETLDILHRQRAFELPPSDVIKDLYRAYFDYAYPHNPILSRVEFARAYSDPQIRPPSYLLLQSVLFAAVGHCDISVIKRAGYNSRYQARAELFKRAKALYDADHETNKVTLVQSLFLMSAWWSSPTDQKDTWHWLGAAIGLAVTMGMHRSTADSILPISDQRLWRRIWWALYTEDKHASIALGRPVHLRLRDCDVEPLAQTDLEEETLSLEDQAVFGATRRDHTLYVIHLSELSKIVERIIDSSRSPLNCSTADRMASLLECENLLRAWTENVPMDFRLSDGLWQRMLFAAHSWFRIVTYRLVAMVPSQPSEPSAPRTEAIDAKNTITRIVEQTLSKDEISYCPIHIIPAMFAAMGMHAIDIVDGNKNALREQLGYVKIRLCMIALRELKGTWPLSTWIFFLFTRIVNRIKERDREYLTLPDSVGPSSPVPVAQVETQDTAQAAPLNDTVDPNMMVNAGISSLLSVPMDFPSDWSDILDINALFDMDNDTDFHTYGF